MTKLRPNNDTSFECPFCRRAIALSTGGFPFIRSQIITHLDRCVARPPQTTADEITKAAEDIARRLRA